MIFSPVSVVIPLPKRPKTPYMETRCNEELCQLTWTASVDRCSTLYQRKVASWRLYVSCDRSWPPLCSEEASSASLAPLAKARCHYTPITGRFF